MELRQEIKVKQTPSKIGIMLHHKHKLIPNYHAATKS